MTRGVRGNLSKRKAEGAAASPRERSKEATREALIGAASQAFAEEGLDAPSLDAICERAGLTRGAFYVHFKDREELIVAVMERTRRGLMDAMILTEGDSGADPRALERTMRFFADAVSSGAYPPRGAVRLHSFLEACARSTKIRDLQERLLRESVQRLAEGARAGQHAGAVRDDVDADALSTLLVALVIGVEVMTELKIPFDAHQGAEVMLKLLGAPALDAPPNARKR